MASDAKTIGFAAVVCLACSLSLSAIYSTLKPKQDLNKAIDLKVKVLQSFGLPVVKDGKRVMSIDQVQLIFTERIEGHVLNSDGELIADMTVSDLTPEQINDRDRETGLKAYYPYYEYTDPESGEHLYAIHVSGMGLWSVIKGYIALETDMATIAGVAIYDHAETPGLGGEIDKDWFQAQFEGKQLVEDGAVQYFRVLKPSETADASSVHGPSGSTMTSKGMTDFINKDFAIYHEYFSKQKGA